MDQSSPIHQVLHTTIKANLGDLVQSYLHSKIPKEVFAHDLVIHLKQVEDQLGAQLEQLIRTVQYEKVRPYYDQFIASQAQMTAFYSMQGDQSPQEQKTIVKDHDVLGHAMKSVKKSLPEGLSPEASLLYSAADVKEANI